MQYSYGYSQLDNLTGGLRPGELILVGARPGMGKTNFALNLVSHFAALNHTAVCLTLDNFRHFPSQRLLWLSAGLRPSLAVSRDSWKRLASAAAALASSDCLLQHLDTCLEKDEFPLFSVLWKKLSLNRSAKILIIDGFHYTLAFTYTGFWKSLRNLARHFSIPVLVTVSCPPACEARTPMYPATEDFPFVCDFDTALFLYRDHYYDFNADNTLKIIAAKTISGNTGICCLDCDTASGRLTEF